MSAAAEHFTATVPADLGMLRDFRHRLTLWLEAAGVREERDAILLAAHEAAANGIQNGAGPVTVVGHVEQDVILIEVISAGRWAAQRQEHSDERGRGLPLMRSLLSEVEILPETNRTIVRLRMIRSQPVHARART
jgi:anti-sigma regulatory factor (Ser/Thr protein kinase)